MIKMSLLLAITCKVLACLPHSAQRGACKPVS